MKKKQLAVLCLLFGLLALSGYGLTRLLITPPTSNASSYEVGDRLVKSASHKKISSNDKQFTEIEWDNLLPLNWDPMKGMKDLNVDELKDSDPRAQVALNRMKQLWNNAPVENSIDGRLVKIPGFAIPLEGNDQQEVDEILLVPYFGACIHTPPPPSNQIIHVKLSSPVPVGSMQPYWVSGKLSVTRFSSDMGDAGYQLKAVSIQPYE
jgi:hypothetical protein